jgi:hypothetical protein
LWFDVSPDNVGADARGNLVLLDVVFDGHAYDAIEAD